MPTTDVDICNKALLRVGHTQFIEHLTPADGSVEQDVCNRCYADCVDEVLSSAFWPFATRRWLPAQIAPGTLSSGAVPTGWTYAYPLPPDLISLRSIAPSNLLNVQLGLLPVNLNAIFAGLRSQREDQQTPFTVEYDSKLQANIALTDAATPEWIYTVRITDPNLFDANFVNALAWRLAQELAPSLRKDMKVLAGCKSMYEASVGDAAASAKRGVRPDQEPPPSWISARGG